ncbi:MAG: sialate O-acetylesterase [Lentisphaeria bacterium]|nr:MAG: sialate O-acetylesterase [Lentisphaeria bacterium]
MQSARKHRNTGRRERKYTIPGKLVRVGRNVIAVRVSDMFGDGGLLGPSDKVYLRLASTPEGRISLAKGWKSRMEFQVNLAKIGERPEPPSLTVGRNSHFPATLYNSMIAPWTIYPIRGVIWYQGESNSGRYKDYMILHPLLIKDWRTKWNNPEMPFLFVQLAAFERHSPSEPGPADFWVNRQPSDSNWPKLREVQTATLAVPNTGMAVAIDIGDPFDIHPADKQTLAYRLAREAERIAYGSRTISAGPLYKSMKIRDGKVYLSFDNVGSGLVANGGAFRLPSQLPGRMENSSGQRRRSMGTRSWSGRMRSRSRWRFAMPGPVIPATRTSTTKRDSLLLRSARTSRTICSKNNQ